MTNFIFKSPRRLIKNSPINSEILDKLNMIQNELRAQRQDNVDLKLMINKLLIDAHLQHQVEHYYDSVPNPKEDQADLD